MYYYCAVETKLKEIDDGQEKSIVLDLPFTLHHWTIWSNGKDMTYSGRVKGAECIALVSVKDEDKEAIQKLSGFIGDTWEVIKKSSAYLKHYKLKVKDMKRQYDEKTDTVIEYKGLDKDEPAKFAEWIESSKLDLEDNTK